MTRPSVEASTLWGVRVARLAVALVVVAGLVAPSGVGPAGAGPAGDPLARELDELLDRREDALDDGDRAAWLATVDPDAPADFVAAQARAFDGWRSVPLADFELSVDLDDSGDLATGLDRRYGADAVLPLTRRTHRLEGFDERDALDRLWLTYVERDGEWFLAADDDLADLGVLTARTLWELGPVTVQPTEHFMMVSRPDDRVRAAALGEIAERALTRLQELWPRPWSERIPLVLPPSADELERMLQSTLDLDSFVAFVAYEADVDEGWQATSPRVYAQDENLANRTEPYQQRVLVHELVHAATAALAGPFVDSWVHEGLAEWVARGRPSSAAVPAIAGPQLPRGYEFRTGSTEEIVATYQSAWSFMSWLSGTVGPDAPIALFEALGAERVAPGSERFRADAAMRAATGLSLVEAEAGWLG